MRRKSDYIKVDWSISGIYQGERKTGEDDIVSQLLSGNAGTAVNQLDEIISRLEGLGCRVEIETNIVTNVRSCFVCGAACRPDAGGVRRVRFVTNEKIIVDWQSHFFCSKCLKYINVIQVEFASGRD